MSMIPSRALLLGPIKHYSEFAWPWTRENAQETVGGGIGRENNEE